MSFLVLSMLAAGAADSAPVAVVVDSKRPGAEHDADELVSFIYLALIDAGVPRALVLLEAQADAYTRDLAFSKARQCEGRTLCLRSLARQLGPGGVVVGVDVGRVGGEVAAHVLAVSATGELLAELDVSAKGEQWRATSASTVPPFARTVASKRLAPSEPPPPKLEPVPVTAEVDPALTPPPLPELAARPLPSALKWSAAGGAGASFIASVALLAAGASGKALYDASLVTVDGMRGTTFTDAEAHRLASEVNLHFSLALGTALLGAVLAAAAAWLFVRG